MSNCYQFLNLIIGLNDVILTDFLVCFCVFLVMTLMVSIGPAFMGLLCFHYCFCLQWLLLGSRQ